MALKDPKRTADKRKLAAKLKRQEDAQAKREWRENDISSVKDQAQAIFNNFIRKRDERDPCISCRTYGNVQWCAGHFRSRGAAGHLRFDEDNCHKQCNRHCNMALSGNIKEYRAGLIKKIGIERVEALENNNEIHRWTIEELREIRDEYKVKLKDLGRLPSQPRLS